MHRDLSNKASGAGKYTVLNQYAVLSLRGDDTVSFLQGQVCGDVESLAPGQSRITAVTNPRGRVVAVVRVLRRHDGCDLVLPSELADTLAQRLRMYVLRARVEIGVAADESTIVAIWGSGLPEPLPFTSDFGDGQPGLLRLGDDALLLFSNADPKAIENHLVRFSIAASVDDWVVNETIAGLPEISAATSESFIPQMLNLDLLDGVSFSKGCYVGQEVIARAHHLGKVKRRSRLFQVHTGSSPVDGQSVMQGDRAVGKVVRVARAQDCFFLLVATSVSEGLTLESDDASELEERPLPYKLPD